MLTGAGPAFCSGGDIAIDAAHARRAGDGASRSWRRRVIRAIWNTPKPVLAAVEGSAFGAGVALAAACDRVVAARDARFATTFTSVGLARRHGIIRLIAGSGRHRAGAPDADAADPLSDAAAAWRSALSTRSPSRARRWHAALRDAAAARRRARAEAYGAIKAMLADGAHRRLELLEREAAQQARLFDTDDFAEGVAAFREKRRPVFGAGMFGAGEGSSAHDLRRRPPAAGMTG